MRLEHSTYIKLVIEAYNRKRSNNTLSPLLARSSPAKIKRECLSVYKERYNKKDDNLLRAFFGPDEPGKPLAQIIRKFETSRFKPLDNYLKGLTEKTEDKNLDLLAWLIDFQPRPYAFDTKVILNGDNLTTPPVSIDDTGKSPTSSDPQQNGTKEGNGDSGIVSIDNGKKNWVKIAIVIFLIMATFVGGGYIIRERGKSGKMVLGNANAGCMYWAEDHYEEIPCNDDRKDRFKFPMDLEKKRNFRRITREDTITEKSIGKVYYIRINGGIEYYTAGGNHPIEVTRNLQQLSPYMFDKHLKKEGITKSDP